MRIVFALPLLLVGGCNVTKDDANNTIGVTVNEQVAANTAESAGNTIENIASDVGNEASSLGGKIQNTDVDVNVNQNGKTENKAQ
jgi:hypothetical protein